MILESIRRQENWYKSIKMPISLRELSVKESDLPTLALRCSRDKKRTLDGYMKLGYDEILDIYKMAYGEETDDLFEA